MKRTIVATVAVVLSMSAAVAFAQDSFPRSGSLRIPIGNDVYVVGPEVTIAEATRGSLFIAGGNVYVQKSIGGDLAAAGGAIVVDGTIRNDVRIFGGTITLNGSIGGDVIVFGGQITISKGASIGGDVLMNGGTVDVEGTVHGALRVRGGSVALLGNVGGATDVRSQQFNLSGTLRKGGAIGARTWYTGDHARVLGGLRYWQPEGERDFTGIVQGKATLDPTLSVNEREAIRTSTALRIEAAFSLFSVLSGALLIAVLMLATKTFFVDAAKRLRGMWGRSLLLGLLYFLLMPVIIFLFCASLIGLPIGLLLLTSYIFSWVFSKPLTAIVLTKLYETTRKKPLHGGLSYLLTLLVFIILKLLFIVPILGWLAIVLAVCMSFGAIMMTKYDRFLKVR